MLLDGTPVLDDVLSLELNRVVQGNQRVPNTTLPRLVGTNRLGFPTNSIRIVTTTDGIAITAYPL